VKDDVLHPGVPDYFPYYIHIKQELKAGEEII
jgi:hypothetical protein